MLSTCPPWEFMQIFSLFPGANPEVPLASAVVAPALTSGFGDRQLQEQGVWPSKFGKHLCIGLEIKPYSDAEQTSMEQGRMKLKCFC